MSSRQCFHAVSRKRGSSVLKQYGFIYTNLEKMKSFINSNSIDKNDTVLIQVFTGVIQSNFIKNVINEVLFLLPKAEIIGATTAGEIYREKILTGTTIISFTVFEKTQVKSKLLESTGNEYELGLSIVKELVYEDTKAIILFAGGTDINSWKVIKGIQSADGSIIICGGKAGDNGYLKETFAFTKEGITGNGVAVVSLTGTKLKVITDLSFGWSTIGKLMTVTEASGNRIFKVDNVEIVDIYKKYLGDDVAKELPMSATEFPLIISRDGVNIARVASRCYDDGSVGFLGNFQVNDKVQFGYGNVNMITAEAFEITNRLKKENVEAIFVYSCSARKAFMQDKVNLEIQPINNVAPTFGFFTYGEFYTFDHLNELLNVTMTVLGISEGEHTFYRDEGTFVKMDSQARNLFEGKHLGIIKVFTNLVNQVTKELQEANKILENQKSKIEQMNKITKSIMEINSEMISSGEIDRLLEMILDKALSIIPKSRCGSILLLENGRLRYRSVKGYLSDKVKNITYKLEDTCHYRIYGAVNLYEPMIIQDLGKKLFKTEEEYISWSNAITEVPRELLTCGISNDGEIIGFINIYNTSREESFNEDDKTLIKYLCYDVSIAYRNSQLLERMLYISRHDSLTGVYNRYYFKEILSKTMDIPESSNENYVVCVVDMNNLKDINDNYGHDAGDRFIKEFAKIFNDNTDKTDIFSRTGGDEFAALFINKDKAEVMNILYKIINVLKDYPIEFDGDIKKITFAYGVSEFPTDSKDSGELLKIADRRMYKEKKRMKGKTEE